MAEDTPDPQALIKLARQTLSSAERRKKFRQIDFMDTTYWYPTQLAFFAAGSSGVHQRLIYGGNQTGKTLSCAAEVTWHLTGAYPDWWMGMRFDKPIRCWAVGESGMLVRDTLQRKLCGDQNFGTGVIPLESFGLKPGKPVRGEAKDPPQGPDVGLFLEIPDRDGRSKRVPIERTLIDPKTNKPMPKVQWRFTGSIKSKPDPAKDDTVYGADMTGTLISIFPVTDETVFQTNLTMKEEKYLKLETDTKLLPPVGTPVKLVIEVPGK